MRQIFTLAMVCLAFVVQAGKKELPLGVKNLNPRIEKLIKESRIHLTDARFRVAASGFPDSVRLSSWDGTAWELDYPARINYTNFGKVASIIFYMDMGGTSLPIFSYQYTYDGAGRTTRIEQLLSIPGMPPTVGARFTMNYDAQGNQTSMLVYEDDNGTLVLASGDSLQITYSGGVATQATRLYWDESGMVPAWSAESRFTNLSFAANGEPTALTISYMDNGSFVEEERYTEVSWKLGYLGFSATFGGLIDIGQFLFQELPATMGLSGSPSDYIGEIKDGANWVLDTRLVSTGAAGAVSQIVEQERLNNNWVDAFRTSITYTSARLTLALSESWNGSGWSSEYRQSWTFDASGNLTEEKSEYYLNNSWTVAAASRHTFNYTTDNKVYRWVSESWDGGANAYVNSAKRDYFFGAFPQSVVSQKLTGLQVYPNPVQDNLTIALETSAPGKLTVQIFNLQGQLIIAQVYELMAGHNQFQLDAQNLPNGIYQLRLQNGSALETVRFVK